MIRCYECKFFKGVGKSERSGWCKNPHFKKNVRVQAIDYCEKAEAMMVKVPFDEKSSN